MTDQQRLEEVIEIVRDVRAHDCLDVYWQMVGCGFCWDEAVEDYPDLSPEEIASAAACGFEVSP